MKKKRFLKGAKKMKQGGSDEKNAVTFLIPYVFLLFIQGGGRSRKYSDEGWGSCKKIIRKRGGGVIQFLNYTPPNPTRPNPP